MQTKQQIDNTSKMKYYVKKYFSSDLEKYKVFKYFYLFKIWLHIRKLPEHLNRLYFHYSNTSAFVFARLNLNSLKNYLSKAYIYFTDVSINAILQDIGF